jgi:hypothetical protein
MHEHVGEIISDRTSLTRREERKAKGKCPHMNRPKDLFAHAVNPEGHMTHSVHKGCKNDGAFSRDAWGHTDHFAIITLSA